VHEDFLRVAASVRRSVDHRTSHDAPNRLNRPDEKLPDPVPVQVPIGLADEAGIRSSRGQHDLAISVGRECGIRLAPCRSKVRQEKHEKKEITCHEECSSSAQGRRKA